MFLLQRYYFFYKLLLFHQFGGIFFTTYADNLYYICANWKMGDVECVAGKVLYTHHLFAQHIHDTHLLHTLLRFGKADSEGLVGGVGVYLKTLRFPFCDTNIVILIVTIIRIIIKV